jgi:hypothetical protein
MHTVENVTGRLIEVRVATPLTLEEVQQFKEQHRAVIGKVRTHYVGVVDLLQAQILPGEVADSLIQLLSGAAPLVERTAFLIGASAVFSLQIERILRNSNNPQRRAFRDPAQLKSWLGEVLTTHEQERLSRFLDGSPGG